MATAFQTSVSISAAPQRVFAVFTDLANASKNISGINAIEILTPGPIGKGTKFRETRTMMGRQATETMEITEFQAPHTYRMDCNSCGAHCAITFRFVPEGGGTRVDVSMIATPTTFFARIMSIITAPMMRGMMEKCFKQDLGDLKRVCENADPASVAPHSATATA